MSGGALTSSVRLALRIILRSNAWEAVFAAVASFNETDSLDACGSVRASLVWPANCSTSPTVLTDSEGDTTRDCCDSRMRDSHPDPPSTVASNTKRVVYFM